MMYPDLDYRMIRKDRESNCVAQEAIALYPLSEGEDRNSFLHRVRNTKAFSPMTKYAIEDAFTKERDSEAALKHLESFADSEIKRVCGVFRWVKKHRDARRDWEATLKRRFVYDQSRREDQDDRNDDRDKTRIEGLGPPS